MSIRLDIFVHESKDPKRLSKPFVEIILKSYGQNDNRISISSECYSIPEVEEAINIIINDLKEIKTKAKKILK